MKHKTREKLFRAIAVPVFLASHIWASSVSAMPLDRPSEQQRIVETIFTFSVASYKTNELDAINKKSLSASADSPERTLLDYLALAERGDAVAALALWDRRGRSLIEKKNASVSAAQLSSAMSLLHKGLRIRFLDRMDANNYVVVRIEKQPFQRTEVETDWFALRREGGVWRLTQDLADDPIACCFHEKTDTRVRRVGVVGGDFRKMLEEFSR